MLELILSEPELSKIIKEKCEDAGMCIEMDSKIQKKDYLVLKIDDYYNSLKEKAPKSPDCLIIQKCDSGKYSISIIELKGISASYSFNVENMIEKFETCLNDFMGKRFKRIFLREYKNIELYFVSNIEIYKRDLGLRMEALIEKKFTFNGKKYLLRPQMSDYKIKKCY
jgi:hypothetical protein